MGYAGNPEPTYMIPTCIADHVDRKDVRRLYLYNEKSIIYLETWSLSQ